MSEIAITALRLGYLVLLWFFVLSAIAILRADIYGTRVRDRYGRKPRDSSDKPLVAPVSKESPEAPKRVKSSKSSAPTHLVVTAGPLTGVTMQLSTSQVLIGRAPSCTLVLDDDFSSNRHARLFPQADGWYVEDLGSTNGTFLDSTRVTNPLIVPIGVPVHVGQSVIELRR